MTTEQVKYFVFETREYRGGIWLTDKSGMHYLIDGDTGDVLSGAEYNVKYEIVSYYSWKKLGKTITGEFPDDEIL